MIKILLVEDNAADVLLMQEALREAGVVHELSVAEDGVLAMEHIRGGDGAELPDLVLLDLNLPRKGGREVLQEVKASPGTSDVPVIVLTTSQSPSDIAFAYRHHANAYVRKPNGLDALVSTTRAISDFWVGTATLPRPAAT